MHSVLLSGSSETVLRLPLYCLCLSYLYQVSLWKEKNYSEIHLAHIRQVSVKHFQSFKPKSLVPVPKVGEFFLDAV